MAVRIDERYEATVKNALSTVSADKGTPAISIAYETSDGPIEKSWYFTEGTFERLAENLEKCFGITTDNLCDEEFLGTIGTFLRGKPCSITTEADKDANGNVRKAKDGTPYAAVQWMNSSRLGKQAPVSALKGMAALARKKSGVSGFSNVNEPPPVQWNTDEDVPF